MGFLNLFLNLAIVSLWLGWRGFGAMPARRPAGTLGSNLRPIDVRKPRRWLQLVGVVGLIVGRALVYSELGSELNWVALWPTGAVTIAFRSDVFARMLLFSAISAVSAILIGYSWLLLFSRLCPLRKDPDPVSRVLRTELSPLSSWPFGLGLIVPGALTGVLWFVFAPLIARFAFGPPIRNAYQLFEQAMVVGLGILPSLRCPLLLIVFLRGLSEFVYFGIHPFWTFVEQAGARLCRPFLWLRLGRLDLSSWAAFLAIWFLGRVVGFGFNDISHGLSSWGHGGADLKAPEPMAVRWLGIGIVPWLFERVSQ